MFSFISDAVDSVVSQITSFVGQIENDIASPFNMMIQQVMGGVWKGRGADAFVNEMQTVLLPEVAALISSLGGMSMGGGGSFTDIINQAIGLVDEVDNWVSSAVGAVSDVFDSICSLF